MLRRKRALGLPQFCGSPSFLTKRQAFHLTQNRFDKQRVLFYDLNVLRFIRSFEDEQAFSCTALFRGGERLAICPKCGSGRVNFQIVQTGAVTRTKNKGCLYGIGRLILIVCTCGLWLLFGRKKSTSRTRITNEKVAICQNCGYQWRA